MTTVEVRSASVRRLVAQGALELHLQLRTDDPGAGDAFFAVLDELNQVNADGGTYAQLGIRSPEGFVVLVDSYADEDALIAWLEGLADRLGARGVTGRLEGVTSAPSPRWLVDDQRPVPTAFVAHRFEAGSLAANPAQCGWLGGPELTARLCEWAATWSTPGGPSAIVGRDDFRFAVEGDDGIAELLRAGLQAGAFTDVLRTDDSRHVGRHVALAGAALATAQVLGRAIDWSTRLHLLREAITALPATTVHAAVRPASKTLISWSGLGFRHRLPAPLKEGDVEANQHLLGRYVYDAHGLQVLTDEHLTRARDLTGWLVSDLGHGRHLVEAADLAPWFATDLPDPAVVDRARNDFGTMLLTLDVIRAEKPPFPRPRKYDR